MSRDAEEPRPRRRPRPAPGPNPDEYDFDSDLPEDLPTTFHPAAAAPINPTRPGKKPPARRPVDEFDAGSVSDLAGEPPRQKKKANPYDAPRRKSDRPREESGGPPWVERIFFGSVSSGHLATFCRQGASYLSAGVGLIKTLESLEKQFARTALGPVIGRLALGIRRGDTISDGMRREPQAFDKLCLSMIAVAEARGGLPETLRKLGDHYEARQRLIRQARGALIYPAIVLTLVVAVGGLLTIFVLPKLVGILEEMVGGNGASLPLPTRMLIGLSHFIAAMGWWFLPLLFFGTIFGTWRLYKTRGGKAMIDNVSLYIPVFGLLMRKIDTTRFARTLSSLLSAGVDYDESLELTADVLHLTPFGNAVRNSREAVMEGIELSEALDAARRFTPDVIAVIQTGEETGQLPETLDRLADDYEDQVNHMVKNLGQLIQPIIVIGLGGVVFFIVLAFVMAYVSVIGKLAGGGL
jgi:type II secretory pathway component PulF